MLPLVEIPDTIGRSLAPYRTLFCREAGFEHICRYISGLILSPNKTLQGIYDLQVWADDHTPSRRAMHEAVFEAAWSSEPLMPRHREVVSPDHRGRGPEVISLDWTFAHHARGPRIWGECRLGLCQRVLWSLSNGAHSGDRQSGIDRWP